MPIRSRPPTRSVMVVALLLGLASGSTGCSLGADDEQAGVQLPVVTDDPLGDVELVPVAPDPADAGAVGVPAGPGPVDPDDRPHPWTRGDDPDLDQLWAGCQGGDGVACDELFDTSPVGSDYERFGLTCGDRPGVIDCTDLDDPDRG